MFNISKPKELSCLASYILETLPDLPLDSIRPFFDRLPADPYISGHYRFRRLSHFKFSGDRLVKLPHRRLFQAKQFNPLVGDVAREYAELEDELITVPEFQNILREFFQFSQLCTQKQEIAVHQIRTTASPDEMGNPAPEGIHRDGVDLVGIFSIDRSAVAGAETHLYVDKKGSPFFSKVLAPGEFLVFRDDLFYHFTSSISATTGGLGTRDVFVCTAPGLFAPDEE
ncbi:2OG-Fe dioxygenase family protein [Chamaesiphon polymorphus]|uniref:2OG-Fe dioxygenase family protein n=1 Tax=Chamaesiphon polymorphus CCALA 037 TaxID=2107692 RepID=A0A2T1F5C7_9CYAN|nr:2OG-Fe dioxygenase family protein [Chamaesiphon polymorphus]PSB40191.1 hypothetical protein C7B77_28670 [Chamaesiphon polymorphus CCALA 037]